MVKIVIRFGARCVPREDPCQGRGRFRALADDKQGVLGIRRIGARPRMLVKSLDDKGQDGEPGTQSECDGAPDYAVVCLHDGLFSNDSLRTDH